MIPYRLALAVTLVGANPSVCYSHDLWFDVHPDNAVLYQGHTYSEHDGQKLVPYPTGAVKSADCRIEDGTVLELKLPRTYPAQFKTHCSVTLVNFSTGYWTQTPWQTVNQPKTGVPKVVQSWLSVETLKLMTRWQPENNQPIGRGLEITPASNPFLLKPGDKLVVVLTDQSIPVKDAPVAYGDNVRGTTDDQGRIAIRLRHGGPQFIRASLETSTPNDSKADKVIRTATFQFHL